MFCIIDLKSNMDRFIGAFAADDNLTYDHLKSNMDRFIGEPQFTNHIQKAI